MEKLREFNRQRSCSGEGRLTKNGEEEIETEKPLTPPHPFLSREGEVK